MYVISLLQNIIIQSYSQQYFVYCTYFPLIVFVLDSGFHVFVWVGKEATPHEKGGGLMVAHVSRYSVDHTHYQ